MGSRSGSQLYIATPLEGAPCAETLADGAIAIALSLWGGPRRSRTLYIAQLYIVLSEGARLWA